MNRRPQQPSPDALLAPTACDRCGRVTARPATLFGLRLCEDCHERLRLGRLTVEELTRAKEGRRG